MTRGEEHNIERAVGRIEAQLEAMTAYLAKVDAKMDAADDWRVEVRNRLERMEANDVSTAFTALQRSIHEGGIRAKSFLTGATWGVALAAGAAGATVATFIKWAWAALTGA
jgi:hypothetical protein